MPKNKGKGGKNRRRGKNENDRDKRELIMKEEGQEYGQVTKILGNGYVETVSFDGTKRRCHIRGKMRKKVWVNNGDIVLISLRDYQKDFGDIIVKYTSEEAKLLKSYKELPENFIVMEGNDQMNAMDDQDITFDLMAPDDYEVPQQRGGYDFPSSGTESDVSQNDEDEEGDDL